MEEEKQEIEVFHCEECDKFFSSKASLNNHMISHTDKSNTHVISLILNIRQDVKQDWPLFIKDNNDNDHQVILVSQRLKK